MYKRKIYRQLIKISNKLYFLIKSGENYIKRRAKKVIRLIHTSESEGHTFLILCINKTVYADMVIENINSLHYLNSKHKFLIYCDILCADYLSKRNKFNYPENVSIKNKYGITNKPWQYYKIEAVIEASKMGYILTDADGIWHNHPSVNKEKITLLVLGRNINDNLNEKLLVETILNKPNWATYNHYVTGFVYIPSTFMTEKLAKDMRDINKLIFESDLNFIINEKDKNGLKRLSEELAINFALQDNYPDEKIFTLKKNDSLGDKNTLESLYYGCCNEVNE